MNRSQIALLTGRHKHHEYSSDDDPCHVTVIATREKMSISLWYDSKSGLTRRQLQRAGLNLDNGAWTRLDRR